MNACVTVEHRFERTPDGAIWTRSNHRYEESRRYLSLFESVRILARVREVAIPPSSGLRADGDRISFAPLPYYVGFEQFCLRWRSVRHAALCAVGDRDAVILKAPSIISCLVESALRKKARPFGLEVIGDPWDLYSRGSVNHPLRSLLRSVFTRRTQSQCRQASAVRYVSSSLQTRYPPSPGAFRASVSDVYLPATDLACTPRRLRAAPAPLRLISVGSLEQRYKGVDVLLHAIRKCVDQGLDCRLVVVGDGRVRPALASLAARLGVDRLVDFRGILPAGESVFAALDECDMFVMPSRQEGMPRALIEAMARALPCIGSAVGGIPQLLDREDLVSPGNVAELAAKIIEIGKSPDRMERMSRQYLERARDFQEHRLSARWRDFLAHVREATELWRGTSSAGGSRYCRRRLMLLWDRPDSGETSRLRPQVLQILARPGGGAAILVILLTRELNRLGYRTLLVTGKCDPLDLDMSYLMTPDDQVEWIPEMSGSVSLGKDLIALWRLYRLMRVAQPAIVQTHTAKAGLLGRIAARLAGVPVVIHTFHGNVMSGYFPPRVSRAIQFAERILAKLTDTIFVLCPQQERDLVERFRVASPRKVQVVPPGLNLEPFQRLAHPTKTEGWLTVGWVGRLVAIKDIALLIEVMGETIRANPLVRFVVAGDGPQRSMMEEAARRWPKERLQWLGWTRDIESFVSRCDILIQTSRNEGTPICLIQGMAAGRPFVSTPAGGVVDMVTGLGVHELAGGQWFANAVLVEPDAQIFASVLCQMQKDRRRLHLMGREAADFAASRYNLMLLARNYDRLYAGFLGNEMTTDETPVVNRAKSATTNS